MRKGIVVILLSLSSMVMPAQITFTVNYDWLKNPSWDRAVEVFNFSRTNVSPALSYLTSGVSMGVGYLKEVSVVRSSYVHFRMNGARYATGVESAQWNLRTRLFRLDAEAAFQFHPKALFRDVSAGPMGTRFFMFIGVSASTWKSLVEVNDQRFFQETKQPWKVRPGALLGVGYRWIILKKRFVVTPRLGVRWFYQAEAPRLIEAMAGSNITDIPAATNRAWLIESGLEFGWVSLKRKGKKGAARPCRSC